MPEHTGDFLSGWIRREGSKSQKIWWKKYLPASGGTFGRKEIKEFLKAKNIQ